MISTAPVITDGGKSMLLRAIGGETITFTRFKIGCGELPSGDSGSGRTSLINAVLDFPISTIDTSMEGNIRITGSFDNTDVSADFKWTEIGIFCVGETISKFSGDGETTSFTVSSKPQKVHKVLVGGTQATITSYNPSTGAVVLSTAPAAGTNNVAVYYTDSTEVLYAYANDGDNAGIIKANMTSVVAEQTVTFVIAIGEAENVTAILSQSLIYASKTDLDNHTAASNPHGVTAEQVGLGNVPNVTTNEQKPTYIIKSTLMDLVSGETLANALAKIARAIKSLRSHLDNKNNPHGVSCDAIGAAPKEHKHSFSDISAGALSPSNGGTGLTEPDTGGLLKTNGNQSMTTVKGTGALYSTVEGNPVFGTLPVKYGGTGASTPQALAESISAYISIAKFGSYSGDGTSKRLISLTFKPKAVLVMDIMGRTFDTGEPYGGLALEGSPVYGLINGSSRDKAIEITDNGFYVAYVHNSVATNASGTSYRYIAFK